MLFLTVLFLYEAAGQYRVYGTISDEDGLPYPGISVSLDETDHQTTTDADGFFVFDDVEEGDYAVIIQHPYGPVYRALYLYDEDQEFDVQIRRRFEFDEITVKGTRLTSEEPFNSENIDGDYIKENNTGQDVPYIFKDLRSTVVNSDAGNGVGYTGIRVRGLDPGHVNVSINGIPLNDAESQLVFWVDLPSILSSTESIQLQRGLGSSTFGSGNFGASINLNTNKTHIDPYVDVETGVGSFNTYRGSVSLGTGMMNGKFTVDGRASYIHSDGYIDRASSDLRSFFLSAAVVGLNSSWRLNVINGHEVTYQAWNGVPFSYVDDKELRTFNSAGTEREGSPYPDEVDNYNQTHIQLFHNMVTDGGEWTLTGFYTRGLGFFENYKADQTLADYNQFYPLDSISFDTIFVNGIERRKWLDNHYYGANLNWTQERESYELKIGAHLSQYNGGHYGEIVGTDDLGSFRSPWEYYRNDATKSEASAFVKLQYSPLDKMYLYGDVQYRFADYQYGGGTDDFSTLPEGSAQFNFMNPKLGLTWLWSEHLKSFASVAVGNREPNRDDFIESGPLSQPKAEKLVDYEVGVTYETDRMQFGLYGYYMDYQDQLVLTGRINDVGEYARVNVANSHRAGIEIDGKFDLLAGLSARFNATISENKIESFSEFVDDWDTGMQIERVYDNSDISFSPGLIGFVGLGYDFKDLTWIGDRDVLSIALDHKYVGEQYLDNTMNEDAKLDAFFYGDLEIAYTTSYSIMKNIRLSFRVLNIWDELYESNGWIYRFKSDDPSVIMGDPYGRSEGNGFYNQTGLYPQAGRHFLATLNVSF